MFFSLGSYSQLLPHTPYLGSHSYGIWKKGRTPLYSNSNYKNSRVYVRADVRCTARAENECRHASVAGTEHVMSMCTICSPPKYPVPNTMAAIETLSLSWVVPDLCLNVLECACCTSLLYADGLVITVLYIEHYSLVLCRQWHP